MCWSSHWRGSFYTRSLTLLLCAVIDPSPYDRLFRTLPRGQMRPSENEGRFDGFGALDLGKAGPVPKCPRKVGFGGRNEAGKDSVPKGEKSIVRLTVKNPRTTHTLKYPIHKRKKDSDLERWSCHDRVLSAVYSNLIIADG